MNRSLSVLGSAVLVLAAWGCSSSSSTPTGDGGASPDSDGGADGGADGGNQDALPDAQAIDASYPVAYTNPVYPQDFPDPFVLDTGSAFYAYATNRNGMNIQAAKSSDMVHWTALPDALPNLPSWAQANAGLTWAPSILKRGASYVMYYVARNAAAGFQCISRAASSTLDGPFTDTSTAPLVCQVTGGDRGNANGLCGSIDPSPFVDADGTAYLIWKSDENASACGTPPRIWIQGLSADGLTMQTGTSPVALLAKDATWEGNVIEGPSMVRDGGVYYLFYSANNYASGNYAIGYATCTAATGACTKVTTTAPWVASATPALGPGGQEFFRDPAGGLWMAYHAWTTPATNYPSGARSLRIDPVTFAASGPITPAPTTTMQTH